jgi:DNA-binding NarL/FixJ family response regulator
MRAREEHEPEKDSGLIWVSCPCKEAITLVGEALGKRARVYVGERPLEGEKPSCVVFCSKGEGVAQGVRRLRTLDPGVPVLLFGLRVDPKLARTALLAGAHGFIHLGMQPAQVARVLSVASEGETIIPRELLETLLVEREQRADLSALTLHQREIVERLAVAATFGGEIVVSRELLETFLVEVATV